MGEFLLRETGDHDLGVISRQVCRQSAALGPFSCRQPICDVPAMLSVSIQLDRSGRSSCVGHGTPGACVDNQTRLLGRKWAIRSIRALKRTDGPLLMR